MTRRTVRVLRTVACLVAWSAPAYAGLDLWTIRPQDASQCAELVRAHPDDNEAYRCFHAIAIVHGKWGEARRGLEALLRVDPGNPRALLYLGEIARVENDPLAESHFTEAARGSRERAIHDAEVYARLGLVTLHDRKGHTDAIARELGLAREAALRAGDPLLIALVLQAEGKDASRRGEWGRAYAHYQEASRAIEEPTSREQRSVLMRGDYLPGLIEEGLGEVAFALGRHHEALEHYARQAAMRARVKDGRSEATARYNVALAATELARAGRLPGDDAHRLVLLALEAAERSGATDIEGWTQLLRSRYESGEARRGAIESALARARERDDRALWCWALASLARYSSERGDHLRAIAAATEAFSVTRELADSRDIRHALGVLGDVHWQAGDRDAAMEAWEAALAKSEAERARQDDDRIRSEVFGVQAQVHRRVASLLLESHARRGDPRDLEDAFRIMERARARGLDEGARNTSAVAVGIGAIREALRENQAMIAYHFPPRSAFPEDGPREKQGHAIVITPERTYVVAVACGLVAEESVSLLLGLIAARDPGADRAAARVFDDLLRAPLAALPADVTRVVVVPDGPLHRLPIAALRESNTGEPLGQRYVFSYTPSAGFWLGWTGRSVMRGSVLAVADPPIDRAVSAVNALRLATLDDALVLARLPRARREARRIAEIAGQESVVLEGSRATLDRLRGAMRDRVSLVHFATHAIVDEAHPERSAVLLAADATRDGLLRSADIEALPLEGRAAVLSACSSAVGNVRDGEGAMSLARSFFRAGARAVVGSLWPLRDDEQERLAVALAEELARGATLADALAAAQRAAIARGAPPAAWAGLVALGDADVAPLDQAPVVNASGRGASRGRFAALALAFAAVAAVTFLRRRAVRAGA